MSTVQTTASDRVRAATAATKSQPALRYRTLTSLGADAETDSAGKAKAAAKLFKQVATVPTVLCVCMCWRWRWRVS